MKYNEFADVIKEAKYDHCVKFLESWYNASSFFVFFFLEKAKVKSILTK